MTNLQHLYRSLFVLPFIFHYEASRFYRWLSDTAILVALRSQVPCQLRCFTNSLTSYMFSTSILVMKKWQYFVLRRVHSSSLTFGDTFYVHTSRRGRNRSISLQKYRTIYLYGETSTEIFVSLRS